MCGSGLLCEGVGRAKDGARAMTVLDRPFEILEEALIVVFDLLLNIDTS